MPSLFELPDPFATMRSRMRPPSPFAAARMGQGAIEDDDYQLQPQEREGLLRSLGRKTVGGIGALANLIDLPGSMIRDTAGLIGSGGNFAKYNPLDQLLTPFSGENRVYGRGLLEDAGVLSKNTPGIDVGDVAGFGVDLLTDPLSWISGGIAGAGTKFGKLASKAGVIDDVLRVGQKTIGKDVGRRFAQRTVKASDIAREAPEAWKKIEAVAARTLPGGVADLAGMSDDVVRSAFGVTVPFTNKVLGNLGTGAPGTSAFSKGLNSLLGLGGRGLDVVDKTPLDAIGSALRWSTPGRHAASLFSAANRGRKTKEVQQAAQQLTQGQRYAEHEVRGNVLDLASKLQAAGKMDEKTSWLLRQVGEGVAPQSADVEGVAGKLRELFDKDFQESLALGLERNQLQDQAYGDVIDYVTRYSDPSYKGKGGGYGSSRVFKTKSEEDLARKGIFKGVRGGTEYLNNSVIQDTGIDSFIKSEQAGWAVRDEALRAAGVSLEDIAKEGADFRRQLRKDVADLVEQNHGANIERTYDVTRRGKTVKKDRYQGLAGWLIAHPEQREKGLFTGHVLADANRNLASSAAKKEVAKTVLDFIGQHAKDPDMIPDGIRVSEVIDKMAGFNTATTERMVNGVKTKVPTVYDILNARGGGKDLTWANKMLPKDLAEDLVGLMPKTPKDESAAYFGDMWNSFNSLWKASVLTRPARYFRDQFSGLAANAQEGMFSLPSALTARRVLLGQAADSALNLRQVQERLAAKKLPLTAANATRELRIMYAQYGPGIHNIATETVGRTTGGFDQSLDELLATMPRPDATNELGVLGEITGTALGRGKNTSWNPLKVRGVMGAEETAFGPVKAGEMAGRYTDDMNRMQPFVYLLEKGWEPEAAMRRINQVQVNYDPRTFTPTERALKQLFPFYTFSSRQASYLAKTLGQRPGGPIGQTMKALNASKSDDPLLPEYVADTAAIPLGTLPDGSKRYLTGSSLMWEDPLQFLGKGVGGASLEAMSRMAPIPKYLAELGTGQSFFQRGVYGGRSLDDLNPPMGQTLANIEESITGVKPARTKPVGSDAIEQIVGTLVPGGSTLTTAARVATDPRRGAIDRLVNTMTGFRTSAISPGAQDAILDELIRKEQRKLGGRSFTKTFIPEEVRATLDPVERLTASRITALAEELAARKKERKKQRMAIAK